MCSTSLLWAYTAVPFHLKNEFRELFLVQDVPGRLRKAWTDSKVLKWKLNKQAVRCAGTSEYFPPVSVVIFSYGNNCLLPGVNVNFLNESVWCGLSAAESRMQDPACGGVSVHVRWPAVNRGCSTEAGVVSLCMSGGLRETARVTGCLSGRHCFLIYSQYCSAKHLSFSKEMHVLLNEWTKGET